jgi:DNA-binding transcriptional LysR family regulator
MPSARDIDVSLLRAFATVVETGSVTSAARLLNRTQAAVSLQIKRLEDLLGQELFRREHRKLTLAPGGEALVGAAQRIVAANDALWRQMTTPDFEGEVRFGVPTDIVHTYVPPVLRRFNKAWPRVRATLITGNSQTLLERMQRGDVDLTLTTDTSQNGASETLRVDRLVWVAAPDSRAHRADPLPLAIGDPTCRFRPVVLEALRQAGREWRLVLEATSQVAQEAAASAGIAVAACLRDSVPGFLGILRPEHGLPPLPDFMINLHLPTGRVDPIAEELARHVRLEIHQRFGPADRLGAGRQRAS